MAKVWTSGPGFGLSASTGARTTSTGSSGASASGRAAVKAVDRLKLSIFVNKFREKICNINFE
uniref:Uncharacterized protein n=1 Tax=Tetranychus urticae TaxID=32264 RepID=T1KQM9_TETUR